MNRLPKKIEVRIVKNKKSGVLIAELPEYDIFTESDSMSGLVFQVNDLVYAFFEVPRKYHGKIWYMPPTVNRVIEEKVPSNPDPVLFHILTSNNASEAINGTL